MSAAQPDKISVLFCCLGNICRSPLAEAVFADLVKKGGHSDKFNVIDSCGTGAYHEGDSPDDRTIAICRRNGVPISGSARKVRMEDFSKFDYIFGMDASNVRNLKALQPQGSKAEIYLFSDFDDKRPIADVSVYAVKIDEAICVANFALYPQPYYGADNGFQTTFDQCNRYSRAFLRHLGLDTTRN